MNAGDEYTEAWRDLGSRIDLSLMPWLERTDDEIFQWVELINKVGSNYNNADAARAFAKHYHDTKDFSTYCNMWVSEYHQNFVSLPAMKLREQRLSAAITRVGRNGSLPPIGVPLIAGDPTFDGNNARHLKANHVRYKHDEKAFLKQCRKLPRKHNPLLHQYLTSVEKHDAVNDKVLSFCCKGPSLPFRPSSRRQRAGPGQEAPQGQRPAPSEGPSHSQRSAQRQGAVSGQGVPQAQRAAPDDGSAHGSDRSAHSLGSPQAQRAASSEGSAHGSQRSAHSPRSARSLESSRGARSSHKQSPSPRQGAAQGRGATQDQAAGPSRGSKQNPSPSDYERGPAGLNREPKQDPPPPAKIIGPVGLTRGAKQDPPPEKIIGPTGLQRKS